MKSLDRLLQRWRIRQARPYIPAGARVLDVGCADGALFRALDPSSFTGLGIDPDLDAPVDAGHYRLVPGKFPADAAGEGPFDVITMLAVLEHIPPPEQAPLARACARLLKPGGALIITVPSPLVDPILNILLAARLIHGMTLEQHYGFRPDMTPDIFGKEGLELTVRRRFQLGLNNLFVFRRSACPLAQDGAASGQPGAGQLTQLPATTRSET